MSENEKGLKDVANCDQCSVQQWKLVENSRWTVVTWRTENLVACVTKSLWPYFLFSFHSIPLRSLFSPVLFAVCVCVPHSSLLLLFFLCQHFTTLIYVFAFIECHLQNDTETFSMFHSVNVLINIMTHSICMMSQLAHFLCHSLNSRAKQYSSVDFLYATVPMLPFLCSFALASTTNKSSFVCSGGRSVVRSFGWSNGWTGGRTNEQSLVCVRRFGSKILSGIFNGWEIRYTCSNATHTQSLSTVYFHTLLSMERNVISCSSMLVGI